MASFTVDALVIGAGPGGYHAAIRLGQLGKKVVCFDRDEVGGVCLNWGCIPTKALLHVAEISRQIEHAGELGLKVPKAEVDREGVAAFADKVVKANVGGVNQLFKANNVEFAYGDASFTGKNTVSLKKRDGGDRRVHRAGDRDRDRQRADRRRRRGRTTATRSSTPTTRCASSASRRTC